MVNGEGYRKGLEYMPRMINRLICKVKKHNFHRAGSCPFTGKTYDICIRCQTLKMV